MLKVAWAEPFKATVAARVVAPSLKVTVPVGVPLPGEAAVTVAVNVTIWPKLDGLTEELMAVELESLLTTCGEPESVPELVRKLLSPL